MSIRGRTWCFLDLIMDKRGGNLSAEKLWYNIKCAISCWALVYYMIHPKPDLNPYILVIFLLFNEASAMVFISIARKYAGKIIEDRLLDKLGGVDGDATVASDPDSSVTVQRRSSVRVARESNPGGSPKRKPSKD